MPIYEFICQSCGNEFEQIQSFSDSSVPACTKCGSTQVVRRMGRPAIHFKGSGWYITDSKKSSDNKGGDNKNGSSKSSGESTASESTTESKNEGKEKAETKSESTTGSTSGGKETKENKSAPAPVSTD